MTNPSADLLVRSGKYLTGTLFLKSNVNLHMASTATILGSTNLEHYSTDVEPCGFVNASCSTISGPA